MHRQEKGVVVRSEAEKDEAEERSRPKIEGSAGLFSSKAVEESFLNVWTQAGKIDQGERDGLRRINDLDRLSVAHLESGAQGLVAADHLGYGSLQASRIERSSEAHGGEQAETGCARFELLQKPEALLGEGERRRSGVRTALDRLISEKLGFPIAELPEEKLAGGRHSASASAAASGLP
jgi:hypothetical protein